MGRLHLRFRELMCGSIRRLPVLVDFPETEASQSQKLFLTPEYQGYLQALRVGKELSEES